MDCVIGKNVTIHAVQLLAVMAAMHRGKRKLSKVPQIGNVVIEDLLNRRQCYHRPGNNGSTIIRPA